MGPVMKQPMLLFATERYQELGQDVAGAGDFDLGAIERKVFPDGERYRRIETDCARRDVVLVGGTVDDVDTLEIYDLACGLVHLGVHTMTLVLPWFGYQTMERASKRGEIVAAKNRARLLSSVPTAGSGNRAVLVDLHSEGIPHYFQGNIRPVHLHARSVVLQAIRDFGGEDFVLGATDAGRAKWVESLANDLLVDAAFVFKRRLSDTQTEITALAADVEDRAVVIYDDMIRTGGSLISAANSYKEAGASKVYAVCTHGVFTEESLDKIRDSGVLEGIACTNTRPRVQALADGDFLRVYSVADLIAQYLVESV
jgi:ribose-phosphate pyrophosphokinase